jgi:hypothetical protein
MKRIALLLLIAANSAANATDKRLNPDVTQANINSTICVAGWTATVRPPASYTSKLKKIQLPPDANPKAYEEDHIVPLACGGSPTEPTNL